MSREIKFRVWDIKDKYWYKTGDGIIFSNQCSHWPCSIGDILLLINRGINTLIVQQYTGLKDKNGVEVYEGDIVKYKTWWGRYENDSVEFTAVVKFKDGAFFPRYIDDPCEDSWYSYKVYDLEIIGNIFENPELIKQ